MQYLLFKSALVWQPTTFCAIRTHPESFAYVDPLKQAELSGLCLLSAIMIGSGYPWYQSSPMTHRKSLPELALSVRGGSRLV